MHFPTPHFTPARNPTFEKSILSTYRFELDKTQLKRHKKALRSSSNSPGARLRNKHQHTHRIPSLIVGHHHILTPYTTRTPPDRTLKSRIGPRPHSVAAYDSGRTQCRTSHGGQSVKLPLAACTSYPLTSRQYCRHTYPPAGKMLSSTMPIRTPLRQRTAQHSLPHTSRRARAE